MTKKCEGADSYPGLVLYSEVLTASGRCGLKPGNQADHKIAVTNASPLTYVISGHSTCDKSCLEYVEDGTDIWDTTFTAPFRWDRKARTSQDQARIAAKVGVGSMPDRGVTVEITCQAAGCVDAGPFSIPLQVDVEAV